MADPESLTDTQLCTEGLKQRRLAERDVPGALERTRAVDAEAWRRANERN